MGIFLDAELRLELNLVAGLSACLGDTMSCFHQPRKRGQRKVLQKEGYPSSIPWRQTVDKHSYSTGSLRHKRTGVEHDHEVLKVVH